MNRDTFAWLRKGFYFSLSAITTLSLMLTHIIGLVGFFIFLFSSGGLIISKEIGLLLINYGIIVLAFALWIIYIKYYVKKNSLTKNTLFAFISIFIILSWAFNIMIKDEMHSLGVYSTIEGILNMAWFVISGNFVIFFLPALIVLAVYLISRKINNFLGMFMLVVCITLVFSPIMQIYINTVTQNPVLNDAVKKSANLLSQLFIFFTGAICFLHLHYLFYNHDYDKLTMYDKMKVR